MNILLADYLDVLDHSMNLFLFFSLFGYQIQKMYLIFNYNSFNIYCHLLLILYGHYLTLFILFCISYSMKRLRLDDLAIHSKKVLYINYFVL